MDRWTRREGLVRIVLAIAIGAVVLGLLAVTGGLWTTDDRVELWGLPSQVVLLVVGGIGLLGGLTWMVRIFRGHEDEPPAWRYRDR